ncbi:MAG: phosphate acetyltransferase, partial [Bacteroidales bacterium]|nr:phosphate acetyltransferase [Bacteroidales bacterium]
MELLDSIKQKAKSFNKRIVLPEGYEERTIKAADIAIAEGLAQIILIGDPAEIKSHSEKLGLRNISKATVIDPLSHSKKSHYIDMMVEMRKHKGMTKEEASKLIEDPLYLGVLMIKNGDADGEVSGADHATGDVLRPAFHYIKTAPGISVVSGAFIMIVKNKAYGDNGVLIFADGGVHPNPTDKELAEIAVASGRTAKVLAGIEPRVALLSFSTKGSAKHEMVDKVI